MTDPQPAADRETWWRPIRRKVVAGLRWSPSFTPRWARVVNWGFIVFFGIDTLLVLLIQFRVLGEPWRGVRRWEDVIARAFVMLWIMKEVERRRTKPR